MTRTNALALIAAGCLIAVTAFAQAVPSDDDAGGTSLNGNTQAPALLAPSDPPTASDPFPDPFATKRTDPFADPLARQPRGQATDDADGQSQQQGDDGLLDR